MGNPADKTQSVVLPAAKPQNKFRVEVMNNHGEPLCVFLEVSANTQREAIDKAKAALQFEASPAK